MLLGVESLTLRYLVSLGLGYLGYLLMLRLWAGALVRRHRPRDGWGSLDGGWPGGDGAGPAAPRRVISRLRQMRRASWKVRMTRAARAT